MLQTAVAGNLVTEGGEREWGSAFRGYLFLGVVTEHSTDSRSVIWEITALPCGHYIQFLICEEMWKWEGEGVCVCATQLSYHIPFFFLPF